VELVRNSVVRSARGAYDNDVVSVEAFSAGGGPTETRGKEGVRGKIDWWVNAMEVHSFDATDRLFANDRFVVQYDADVTDKESKHGEKCPRSAFTR